MEFALGLLLVPMGVAAYRLGRSDERTDEDERDLLRRTDSLIARVTELQRTAMRRTKSVQVEVEALVAFKAKCFQFCRDCGRRGEADWRTAAQEECTRCGELDCPHGEPLHWHHDGCPACWDCECPLHEKPPAVNAGATSSETGATESAQNLSSIVADPPATAPKGEGHE